MGDDLTWHKVAEPGELGEGQVRMVKAGERVVALSYCNGRYGALDNVCPHRGGPLGAGSIEDGLLVCPWHGNEYDPVTGKGHDSHGLSVRAYAVEERADGVYLGLPGA